MNYIKYNYNYNENIFINIFTENELNSMKDQEITCLYQKYNLSSLNIDNNSSNSNNNKDIPKLQLIKDILDYQEYVLKLQSILIKYNPIYQCSYDDVHFNNYKLPIYIIQIIIKFIWFQQLNSYHIDQTKNSMRLAYRNLLSLSLLSKDFFPVISHQLQRIKLDFDRNILVKDSLWPAIGKYYSPLKNIVHLTMDTLLLNTMSISHSTVELQLMFGNVRSLILVYYKVIPSTLNTIKNVMTRLEKLKFHNMELFQNDIKPNYLFQLLREMNSITSLNFSTFSTNYMMVVNENTFSPNLKSLKLPYTNCQIDCYPSVSTKNSINNYKKDLQPSQQQQQQPSSCCSLETVGTFINDKINSILSVHLTKLIIYNVSDTTLELNEFLQSKDCRIHYLAFHYREDTLIKSWISDVVSKSYSIETLEFLFTRPDNTATQLLSADQCRNVTTVISHVLSRESLENKHIIESTANNRYFTLYCSRSTFYLYKSKSKKKYYWNDAVSQSGVQRLFNVKKNYYNKINKMK